jgi:tRNA A37 threonylcarbamoyladenosine synthetase subunit TsaC/SUA5/YrdC
MRYIGEVSEVGQRLMKKLWPGRSRVQFDVPAARRAEVAKQVGVAEAEIYANGTIALRCPDHIVATDVLGRTDARSSSPRAWRRPRRRSSTRSISPSTPGRRDSTSHRRC